MQHFFCLFSHPGLVITFKSFYYFCVFLQYRQNIETYCKLISVSTNFLEIMICWYYFECSEDGLKGTGIWGSWLDLAWSLEVAGMGERNSLCDS